MLIPGVPVKRLQVCGGIAQPNENISQKVIVYVKEKASIRDTKNDHWSKIDRVINF